MQRGQDQGKFVLGEKCRLDKRSASTFLSWHGGCAALIHPTTEENRCSACSSVLSPRTSVLCFKYRLSRRIAAHAKYLNSPPSLRYSAAVVHIAWQPRPDALHHQSATLDRTR